ncbi:MAG: hypothetical protein Q9226_006987 [Calogaya cf. arnoldii]
MVIERSRSTKVMIEESDGEADDSASELPELNHVIESYLPSPSPPKKRRKVETTNPLNKPFKSPFRTPLKPTPQSESDARLPASSFSTSRDAVQQSSPISTTSTFSTAQRSTHTLASFHPSTSPTKSGSQLDKLQKYHTHLLNTLSSFRARLETTTQALEIEASSEDAELEGLIQKWRVMSREAAEEVFVGMKEKVDGMGGWKKWRSTQAESASGWNDQDKKKGCAENDDESDREEEGKEEKGERKRIERDVKEQAEKEDEDKEDEGFTMETMLKSLDIPLGVIGYDKVQQRWND